MNTQVFINFGKGFYRFEGREPVGSTAGQQINRTKFLEIGFLSNPGGQVEIRGSLWGTKNDSDFAYNMEDENSSIKDRHNDMESISEPEPSFPFKRH